MQNYTDTILAQYANSSTITGLIGAMNQWIDPTADLDAFYDRVWNIQTATGYGLDVWGKIVNISRVIRVPSSGTYFGFSEGSGQPFGQATFYAGASPASNITLGDDDYRTLILVKAMTNISNCTVPSLNAALQYLFAQRGRCFVQDTGDMTLRYVFEFELTPAELSILLYSGALARPAGVLAAVVQIADFGSLFGFAEGGGQPFGQGNFFGPTGIQNVVN